MLLLEIGFDSMPAGEVSKLCSRAISLKRSGTTGAPRSGDGTSCFFVAKHRFLRRIARQPQACYSRLSALFHVGLLVFEIETYIKRTSYIFLCISCIRSSPVVFEKATTREQSSGLAFGKYQTQGRCIKRRATLYATSVTTYHYNFRQNVQRVLRFASRLYSPIELMTVWTHIARFCGSHKLAGAITGKHPRDSVARLSSRRAKGEDISHQELSVYAPRRAWDRTPLRVCFYATEC